jgi:outer membrane protein TolC
MMKSLFLVVFIVVTSLCNAQGWALKQMMDTALLKNFSVLIAKEQVNLAETQNNAGNAGFLPSVWIEGGANITENNTKLEFFNGEIREAKGAGSGGLNGALRLNWTVFDGMKMFIEQEKLNAFQNLSEYELKAVIIENIASLTEEYYATLRDLKFLEIYKNSMDFSRKRLVLAKNRFALGVAPETEFLNAQIDFNNDSSSYRQLLLTKQIHLTNLNMLMGRAADAPLEIENINIPESIITELISKEDFSKSNPEYILAEKRVQLAFLNIKSANSGIYPSIDVNAAYSYNSSFSEVGILQSNRSLGPTVGITARWNIFDARRINTEIKSAKIQYEVSRLTKENILAETQKEWYVLTESAHFYQQLISFEEENVAIAQKNVEISMRSYELGGISEILLRESQNKLNMAEIKLLQSKFEKIRTEINLKRLAGNW